MPSVSESWAPNGCQQLQCLCLGFGRRRVHTEGFGRGKSTRLGARDPAGIAENDFQAFGKCAEAGSFGAILEPSCVLAFGVLRAFGRSRRIAGAGDFLEFRSGEQPVPPDFPHVPFDIVRERSLEDVGAHPLRDAMVDRTKVQVDRRPGSKCALDAPQPAVPGKQRRVAFVPFRGGLDLQVRPRLRILARSWLR